MEEAADHFARKGATGSSAPDDPEGSQDTPGPEPQTRDQTPVFRAVTGVYRRRGETLGDQERALLLRVLRQIMPNVDMRARRDLSRDLADDPDADPDLVRLFLSDQIEIARPLLERCGRLSSDDLVRIVLARGAEFRRVVAARAGLPPQVTAALAETGDRESLKVLLKNHSARISGSTFTALAAAARRDAEIKEALQRRPDAPEDLAAGSATASAPDPEAAAAALAAKLYDAGQLRVSMLIGALRQKQTALFEHAFALLTGLPVVRMRPLLRDPSGFPMALAARAARLDRSAFSTVFVKYCEARGVSPQMDESDLARAMEVFRNLPQEGARAELHRLGGVTRQASPFHRSATRHFVSL